MKTAGSSPDLIKTDPASTSGSPPIPLLPLRVPLVAVVVLVRKPKSWTIEAAAAQSEKPPMPLRRRTATA